MRSEANATLAALFLISAGAIGYEIAITRYFAVASWSEYGYWVISIAMVGFAVSGVVLSLFSDFFQRQWRPLLDAIPPALLALAALGFYLTAINPFNPLEFQNPDAWLDQLLNIGKYYAALFPAFFLAGMYVGLCFLAFQEQIPKVYAVDLAGAAFGALAVLTLMFWLHPFYLLAALLPLFALAALMRPRAARAPAVLVTVAVLLPLGEWSVLGFNRAEFNQYKSIYPPLHVEGNRLVRTAYSPRGYFVVLDNFTERLDSDFSNNLGLLGAADPPATLGLYKDGSRIGALPKTSTYDISYVKGALDAFPYELARSPRVLLIGTRGGFRMREALALGADSVLGLEPSAPVFRQVVQSLREVGDPVLGDARVRLSPRAPVALAHARAERFDIIDIASDFLDQADTHKFAFTVEALAGYYPLLDDGGVISIPVSMRELTVYAVKLLETARVALARLGITTPERHLLVYRSAWNARILIGERPFTATQIARLRAFCEQRSFDTAYYFDIDPARVKIWNDLPAVSFEHEAQLSSADKANDALMQDALVLLGDKEGRFLAQHFFDLSPSTYDRPSFHSVLRLSKLDAVLARIALIPREELGTLINLAVIAQSIGLAIFVLTLPLLRWRRRLPRASVIARSISYFAGLGLGFLFLEILLIEKAAFFLDDRTYAFALVLSGMLVCSGLGSYAAGRYLADPRRGITLACGIAGLWVIAAFALLDPLLAAALELPFAFKSLLLLAVVAPLAFALGFPFPLGLYLFRGPYSNFLPWAWSLNGAFSVIATPLANLLAISHGYRLVLLLSAACYLAVYLSFPVARGQNRLA